MSPWTDQTFARYLEAGEQAADGAGVRIEPAAHDIHGTDDTAVVGGDGPALPIAVIALMRGPALQDGGRCVQALQPLFPPIRPRDLRVGRSCHIDLEICAPFEVLGH